MASVGPPSSRSDWTPSDRERRELLVERPAPQLELRAGRQRPAPEREAARLAHDRNLSRVEARIVRPYRAHPDRDRIGCGPQLVHEPARGLSRDPARPRQRRPPVEGDRRLVGHERPPLRDPGAPGLVLGPRLEGVHDLDLDPGPPQRADPVHFGVRILRADHDPRDARGDQRVGARRRRAVMGARLESDVDRRPPRALTCARERDHLGVRPPLPLVPALPDHLAVRDDHRAHDRVRIGGAAPSLGELEGPLEAHSAGPARAWTSRR